LDLTEGRMHVQDLASGRRCRFRPHTVRSIS